MSEEVSREYGEFSKLGAPLRVWIVGVMCSFGDPKRDPQLPDVRKRLTLKLRIVQRSPWAWTAKKPPRACIAA